MNDHPKRGGIYWIHFPASKQERVIGDRRPGLVLSNDINNQFAGTVTVAPITGSENVKKVYRFHCFVPQGVGGLDKDSVIKLEQVMTIDQSIVGQLIGMLPNEYLDSAVAALKIHLGI